MGVEMSSLRNWTCSRDLEEVSPLIQEVKTVGESKVFHHKEGGCCLGLNTNLSVPSLAVHRREKDDTESQREQLVMPPQN